MSTVDTSSWNPDANLNTEIEGIPLNESASIAQTWKVIAILMAAMKGDTDAIKAMISVMQGATASADGSQGLVPAPEAGDQDKVLKGDGTWDDLAASDIPALDASKIASGTIDIARLPAGALERLVTVANQAARYALTTADVQLGDTVKQLDTGTMYIVVDTSKLNSADGYVEYTAGSAASVPWSGVTSKPTTIAGYGITDANIASGVITLGSGTITPLTSSSSLDASKLTGTASVDTTGSAGSVAWSGVTDKPSSYTPSSHTHGNITNDGKVGSTSGKPLITGTGGAVQAGSFGTSAGSFCEGNDSRLSDARTPTSHSHGNVSNAGAIGSAAGLPVVTGTNGVLQAGSFGSTAGTVCEGNDSRLSDDRTPTAHSHGNITSDGKLGTASRVVVTDGNKAIGVSSVTATELGYLSGVTSSVQTQINEKAADSAVVHAAGNETVGGIKTFTSGVTIKDSTLKMIVTDTTEGSTTTRSGNIVQAVSSDSSGGLNVRFGGGSNTVIGAGEAQASLLSELAGSTTEKVFVIADDEIVFHSNANTYSNKKTVTLTAAGSLTGLNEVTASTFNGNVAGNAATATQFSANKSVTLTGDVTGSASSTAGWSIATTVGAITNTQIAAMFENDGVDPSAPPMTNPERAVLCGDGAWRYFEQIAFPN